MTIERRVDSINIRIPKINFVAMYNAHKAFPKSQTIHLNQTTKKGDFVTPNKFDNDLMPRWIAYYKAHNDIRASAIWTVKAPAEAYKSTGCYISPRWLNDYDLKQNTQYYCACNSAQQTLYELYNIRVPESELSGHMGTTSVGTGPNEMANGIKHEAEEHGHKVTVEFKNFSDVGWQEVGKMIMDPNIVVFFHEMYRRKWGHYEYPYALCINAGVVKMANSLSGGYLENRSLVEQKSYFDYLNQPSLVIVRKVS